MCHAEGVRRHWIGIVNVVLVIAFFFLVSCGDDADDSGEPTEDTQFPESGHRGDVYTTIVEGERGEYECVVLDGTGTGDSDMECPGRWPG